MEIPAAERQGDEADARLDQPPRQQCALAPLVAAVAVAEPRVFLAQVKGPAQFLAQDDRKCLAIEMIEARPSAPTHRMSRRAVSNAPSNPRRPCALAESTPAGSARFGTW